MDDIITITVGFDQKEAVAYHTFCQSVIERCSAPLRFIPLAENTMLGYSETHTDGSNKFIYTRFLTPHLMNHQGWALFCDGDMVCLQDVAKLWAMRDPTKAVQVVQHDYKTKVTKKYLGNKNEDYPRKNWSSVILWNCAHPAHKVLTPTFIQQQSGAFLHRFKWIDDQDIGALPTEWNWLAIEYDDNPQAGIIHYTLGTPCFADYRDSSMSEHWKQAFARAQQGMA